LSPGTPVFYAAISFFPNGKLSFPKEKVGFPLGNLRLAKGILGLSNDTPGLFYDSGVLYDAVAIGANDKGGWNDPAEPVVP
jgi:hypothetical protein